MGKTISEAFGELSITISSQQIHGVEKQAVHFFLRKTHPLTFDGPYCGVDPVAWTTSDTDALFELFQLHPRDVEAKIRECPAIDRNFIVTSDPFNLLVMWLCHLAPIYIKDKRVCHDFMSNVLRLFMAKIFCSVVNNTWRYGANRGVMEATIMSLSRKSDIIRFESWRRLIESHIEKILDPHDRFYPVLVDASPDDMFLRVVSENQTALRAKIITFANAYYEAHAAGDMVGFISSVATSADGEKIIAQTASVIDSATAAMVSELLNPNMFIHDVSIADVAKMFSTISPNMLKTALLQINETAVIQAASRKFDIVKHDKEGTLFVGIRALMTEIVRTMVRICRVRQINIANHALVFKTMRDAFSSSRSLDKDIQAIKRSVAALVDPFNITVNQASQSALRLGVSYYLIYRTLGRMKV